MRLVRPASIRARLALLFAATVMATFMIVGSYLYRSLAIQLERRDDAELIGKISQTRHLLEAADSLADVARAPDTLLNAMFGHDGLLFLILAADGRVLVQNTAFTGPLPPVGIVPVGRSPTDTNVKEWTNGETQRRVVIARGTIGKSGEEAIIVVARDVSDRSALLRDYRIDLILAAVVGALIATALGYVIVRRGLRPIDRVAKKANEITSLRLDTRLRLEDTPSELSGLIQAFNAMLDRLEDGVRRLSGFAADLAHDLRTPVTALMVKTEVALSRARTSEEYCALLESNVEEYERLARLIESTLFLARADNEQLALRKQRIDAAALSEKVMEYFSGIAEEAGVSLVVKGAGTIVADAVLLQRAIGNLVSNAIRYTPAGETVQTVIQQEANEVSIAVENRGAGIPSDQLDRVFDRYFRGDAARSEGSGSAGLGLAIVRAITTLHRGSVSAVSDPYGFTRFVMRFPHPASMEPEPSTSIDAP